MTYLDLCKDALPAGVVWDGGDTRWFLYATLSDRLRWSLRLWWVSHEKKAISPFGITEDLSVNEPCSVEENCPHCKH